MTFFAGLNRTLSLTIMAFVAMGISALISSCGDPMSAAIQKYKYKDPTSGEPTPVRPSSSLKEESFKLINIEFEEPTIYLQPNSNTVEFSVVLIKNGKREWHKLVGQIDEEFNAILDETDTAWTDTFTRGFFSCLDRLKVPKKECSEVYIDFYFTHNGEAYKNQFLAINEKLSFSEAKADPETQGGPSAKTVDTPANNNSQNLDQSQDQIQNHDQNQSRDQSQSRTQVDHQNQNTSPKGTDTKKNLPAPPQKTVNTPASKNDEAGKEKGPADEKKSSAEQKQKEATAPNTETISPEKIKLKSVEGEFKGVVLPDSFYAPIREFLKKYPSTQEPKAKSQNDKSNENKSNEKQSTPPASSLPSTPSATVPNKKSEQPPQAPQKKTPIANNIEGDANRLAIKPPTPIRLPRSPMPERDTIPTGQESRYPPYISGVIGRDPYTAEIQDTVYNLTIVMDFETGGKAEFSTGSEAVAVPTSQGRIITIPDGRIFPEGTPIEKVNIEANFKRYESDRKAYATGYLARLIRKTSKIFSSKNSECQTLEFGNFSAIKGGKLAFDSKVNGKSHHASHQNGLEADMRYFYPDRNGSINSRSNQSLSCNYNYVKYMAGLRFTDIDQEFVIKYIFMTSREISLLRNWQKKQKLNSPEDERTLEVLYPVSGHGHHMHIRSNCPPMHDKCFNSDEASSLSGSDIERLGLETMKRRS